MISTDTIEDNTQFAKENGANFPFSRIGRAYGERLRRPKPRFFARRVTFYIAPDGAIAHIDQNVSVRTAGIDIVRRLKALGY